MAAKVPALGKRTIVRKWVHTEPMPLLPGPESGTCFVVMSVLRVALYNSTCVTFCSQEVFVAPHFVEFLMRTPRIL